MTFRDRLLRTIRALGPLFEEPGVLVAGSEVPNLLRGAEGPPVIVSQDIDIAVPVEAHARVKRRLVDLGDLRPSSDEPSVWVGGPELLEVNFIGLDRSLRDPSESYVFEDESLPLLVFGCLSLLEAGPRVVVEGTRVPLPRPAGLLVEKLLTDRSGVKGERDLLVALALLSDLDAGGRREVLELVSGLAPDLRHQARANLQLLSLLLPIEGMPDPRAGRPAVLELIRELEGAEGG